MHVLRFVYLVSLSVELYIMLSFIDNYWRCNYLMHSEIYHWFT